MGSIRRHKNAMSALLAEFYDKPNNNLEFGDEFDDYVTNKKRREDEGSAGGMCQSVVRYARPQKAKAASGEWKFIVNTGQHTQTLRLEKCSNPGDSCSYLAQTYRSHCSQVYNYHRLLSWDKVRGLHVDIFKVPTCCSCQVDGYRQQFPPLSTIQAKDYTPINNYKLDNGYSTINEEDLDYNDESDEDDLGLSYSPYNHHRDTNELSYLASKKVRSKLPLPSSVGPYLSPPDDDNHFGSYKPAHKSSSSSSSISSSSSPSSSSSKNYYQHLSRRRPQQHNEPRVDVDLSLDLAGSETQSEQEPPPPLEEQHAYPYSTYPTNHRPQQLQQSPVVVAYQPEQELQQQQQVVVPPMPMKQPGLLHPAQLHHLTLPSTRVSGSVTMPTARSRDLASMRPSRRRPLLQSRSQLAQRRHYYHHPAAAVPPQSSRSNRRHSFHSQHHI
ncbi:neurotrophin 1 [Drosophila grimshawi]|uniref:neurotrophin 1 n=1 Tax=Drosophila grimshawi TaxID=7222 RepID=UPI000C86E62B|nr:neurotrophin 1 [Drosophila grimshawi]